jgi:hypothetical protein
MMNEPHATSELAAGRAAALAPQARPVHEPASSRAHLSAPTSRLAFARHVVEMVVAMLVGMGVVAGVASLAFAAAGSSLTGQSGAFRVMLVGLSMTVPMVAWMAHRGHGTTSSMEMAAAMPVPSAVAAGLAAVGVLGAGAALAVQHAAMVPAMLAVMLWRYDEYARPHAAGTLARGSQRPRAR